MDGLLSLANKSGRFYVAAEMAAAVCAEHGERVLARRLVTPGRRRR